MITDTMIKSEFIHRVLMQSAGEIADTQASRLRSHARNEAQTMAAELSGHPFTVNVSGLSATLTFNLHMRLRFMDMALSKKKYSGSQPLYNKVVWGTMYRKALGELKYGFTEDIRKSIGDNLRAALAK